MNIHYKTNMNTQHNEYQHVITKNVFKHNFLGTLNIFHATSYKGSFFCCFNPSVSPLQLCPVIWATPTSCFQDANCYANLGVSFQYQWHDPERPLDFPVGFWCNVPSQESRTLPFPDASDSSGSTKSQPYLTSWINWWVSYKQHSQGMDTLHKTHVLGRHIWCFIVA